jgi:hypothetical protein
MMFDIGCTGVSRSGFEPALLEERCGISWPCHEMRSAAAACGRVQGATEEGDMPQPLKGQTALVTGQRPASARGSRARSVPQARAS